MRNFEDRSGTPWTAYVVQKPGDDYKGRFHLAMRRSAGSGGEVSLTDVRWNSERAARSALETMSLVELRRRLRSALGRASLTASV